MAWTWQFKDAQGAVMDHQIEGGGAFPSQSDAETWLGEEWPSLLEAGVDAVDLLEDGRVVYGPMSLQPPS